MEVQAEASPCGGGFSSSHLHSLVQAQNSKGCWKCVGIAERGVFQPVVSSITDSIVHSCCVAPGLRSPRGVQIKPFLHPEEGLLFRHQDKRRCEVQSAGLVFPPAVGFRLGCQSSARFHKACLVRTKKASCWTSSGA